MIRQTPTQLAVGLLFIGLFASIYHPVGIAMVASHSEKIGRALGINGVFGNLGVAIAPFMVGFLIEHSSWRMAFIVPGIFSVGCGLLYMLFIRHPRNAPKAIKSDTAFNVSMADTKRVLLIIAIATIAATTLFNSTTISLPKVFSERLGDIATSASSVGTWIFLVFLVAATAQVIIGILLDRYPFKPIYMIVVFLQIPVFLIVAHATELNMVFASTAMMFLIFGTIPIHDTIVARYTQPQWRSRVYAVKYLLGLGFAAVSVHLVGWSFDETGDFTLLFYILAGCACVISLGSLAMPYRRVAPKDPALKPAE